jgi:8-oxo-dGTP diphosphatase
MSSPGQATLVDMLKNAGARHSVSVAGVVVREDGRALMIRRRDNGKWEAPGGVLELGETIYDGVRREVLEETGLVIEPEALTGVYKNMPRGIVALVFLAHVVGGSASTTTDETTQLEWMTAAQVEALCDEAYSTRVVDALNFSGQVAIREHDGVSLIPTKDAAKPSAA